MKKIQNLTNVVRPIIICATTVTICRVMAIYMSDGNIVTAYSYEKTCLQDFLKKMNGSECLENHEEIFIRY